MDIWHGRKSKRAKGTCTMLYTNLKEQSPREWNLKYEVGSPAKNVDTL